MPPTRRLRAHITKQPSVYFPVSVGRVQRKCFQSTTESSGRSQQPQLCRQAVPCRSAWLIAKWFAVEHIRRRNIVAVWQWRRSVAQRCRASLRRRRRYESVVDNDVAMVVDLLLLLLLLHPFNGLFSKTTWVSWYQKGKTIAKWVWNYKIRQNEQNRCLSNCWLKTTYQWAVQPMLLWCQTVTRRTLAQKQRSHLRANLTRKHIN